LPAWILLLLLLNQHLSLLLLLLQPCLVHLELCLLHLILLRILEGALCTLSSDTNCEARVSSTSTGHLPARNWRGWSILGRMECPNLIASDFVAEVPAAEARTIPLVPIVHVNIEAKCCLCILLVHGSVVIRRGFRVLPIHNVFDHIVLATLNSQTTVGRCRGRNYLLLHLLLWLLVLLLLLWLLILLWLLKLLLHRRCWLKLLLHRRCWLKLLLRRLKLLLHRRRLIAVAWLLRHLRPPWLGCRVCGWPHAELLAC